MPSLNPFHRQQPDRPTLRQRAADLKAGLSRLSPGAEPNQAPALPTTALAVDAADISTLARIARHRLARNRWTDAVMPADRAWRLRHDLDVSAEAVAAAEAERDAADALVTATWNSLFEAPPASSAELLALLRHAQHHVDEDHAPDAAIELSGMVRAIGDAVESLRDMPLSGSGPDATVSPDRFLIDLGPTLLPLLDEADTEWAKVHALYLQAEAACQKEPTPAGSQAAYKAFRDQFDVALVASGYRAAWEAIQPLYERIEALVGPLMNVPVQTLEGLILKQRIGQTLSHFEDDAAKDLTKLAKVYQPGVPASRPPKVSAPLRLQGGLVDQIDFASASQDDLRSLHDIADEVGTFAYALVWTGRCHVRGWDKAKGPEDQYNAAGKLMQWLGDALTDVTSAAQLEARLRRPTNSADRETRLSTLAATTIGNGDPDEIEAFARELLAHAEAERRGH